MNKVNIRKINEEINISIEDVMDILNIPLLGVVYEDESVVRANNHGMPLIMDSKSVINKCYLNISRRLTGEDIKLAKYKRSIFERIFS
jgi:septum site-determining protein MinD